MKKSFPLWVVILAGFVGFMAATYGAADKLKALFEKK